MTGKPEDRGHVWGNRVGTRDERSWCGLCGVSENETRAAEPCRTVQGQTKISGSTGLTPELLITPEMEEAGAGAILGMQGFGFYTDPMEGGQDAYDLSLVAMSEAARAYAAMRRVDPSIAELTEALAGLTNDYMTSENHHPGYVLIPTAKFELLAKIASNHGSPGGSK